MMLIDFAEPVLLAFSKTPKRTRHPQKQQGVTDAITYAGTLEAMIPFGGV